MKATTAKKKRSTTKTKAMEGPRAIVHVRGNSSGIGTVAIHGDGRVWFYLTRLPKPGTMPSGLVLGRMVLAHNPVWPPARTPGVRGSRWWLELPNKELKSCSCGIIGGRHYCYAKTPSKAHLAENARRIRRGHY